KASPGTPGKEGFKLILTGEGELSGTVGGGALEKRAINEAKEVMRERKNRLLEFDLEDEGMLCGGRVTLTLEFLEAGRGFVIFGGGHIGRALGPILESLAFRVTVFDNRPEVKEMLGEGPRREIIIGDYRDISTVLEKTIRDGFCFVATHGHNYDYDVVKQLLSTEQSFFYLGMIGSKKKVGTLFQRLQSEGIVLPDYLYAPVGLDLGGDTAAEIAVSIAAEVITIIRGKSGTHLRLEKPPENSS
ncbi:MAG: hypothetical protein GH155_07940, partial [Spirochaeta sp.]|nr:hypothetical protein [Spirochaeta sp.]